MFIKLTKLLLDICQHILSSVFYGGANANQSIKFSSGFFSMISRIPENDCGEDIWT
jgi:hypothetical protein